MTASMDLKFKFQLPISAQTVRSFVELLSDISLSLELGILPRNQRCVMHFSFSTPLILGYALASVLSQQPSQQAPPPGREQWIKVISPNHIGITVHSIADALPFWNGILGLPLAYIYNSTDQPISTLV